MTTAPPDHRASRPGGQADRAAAALRERIAEGRLRSGERLPEERLSAELGVSRNTLREAFARLAAERVVVREPHRGVVVATPGVVDVLDVYRVRRLLEPAVCRAVVSAPAGLDRLDDAVREGRAAASRDDWAGVASANQHFHRALVALAGSPRLDEQMDLLLAEMRLIFSRMGETERFHRPYLEENGAIAALLREGRGAEAADRLAAYLEAAETSLVEAIGAL